MTSKTINVMGTPVRTGINLQDAQAIAVEWNKLHPRPQVPYMQPIPKGTPNRKQSEKERLEPYRLQQREWEEAWRLVRKHSGLDEFERADSEQKRRQRIDDTTQKYAKDLQALDWAQSHAGRNKDAELEAQNIRMGYDPFGNVWRAWYAGAAQYVAKQIRRAGGKREYTSGRSGAKGSIYYRMPDGDRIRISDHELPETDERQYNRSIGIQGRWNEIVLDRIMSQEEIDELIKQALEIEEDQ